MPGVDCVILDRMCKVVHQIERTPSLKKIWKQVKHKSCDVWHGWSHKDGCPCSPWQHDSLWERLEAVNSSRSEQTFSWFRGYTPTFNNMSPNTQRFYVHYFAKRHNFLMVADDDSHLSPFPAPRREKPHKKGQGGYQCSRKVQKTHLKRSR